MFKALTEGLYGSNFYKQYMSGWPAPLNDASFDIALILFILVLLAAPEIVIKIRDFIGRKRIARNNVLREAERIKQQEIEREERYQRQYHRFLQIAELKHTTFDVTYEQFRIMKLAEEDKVAAEAEATAEEKNPNTLVAIQNRMTDVRYAVSDAMDGRKASPKPQKREDFKPAIAEPVIEDNEEETKRKNSEVNPVEIKKDEVTEVQRSEKQDNEAYEVPNISLQQRKDTVAESDEEATKGKSHADIEELLQKGDIESNDADNVTAEEMDDFNRMMANIKKAKSMKKETEKIEEKRKENIENNERILEEDLRSKMETENNDYATKIAGAESPELKKAKEEAMKKKQREEAMAAKRAARGKKK